MPIIFTGQKGQADMTIEEIEEYLRSYKKEVGAGGHPLMSETIYVAHVDWLIQEVKRLEGENHRLREILSGYSWRTVTLP